MKWISVEDALPEMNHDSEVSDARFVGIYLFSDKILAYDAGYDRMEVCVYAVEDSSGRRYENVWRFADGEYYLSKVTHWMPLPESPK